MPKYSPDFSQEFKPLDPGTYTAKVDSFEEKSSQKDGSPYLQWTLEITDEAYAGSKVWNNTMLSGRGAGMLKHFLKSCDGSYDGGEFDPQDYVGSKLGITLENRDYKGKTVISVKEVFPLDPNASEPSFEESDIPF